MPILIGASVALQFFCLVHMARTGRPYYWAWLILLGSFLGSAVYIVTQVIPDLRNDPRSRRAVRNVADRIDPERSRRRIALELEAADTVDNRRRLADECLRLGDYVNAAELYRSVLKGIYADDPAFLLSLAKAQSGTGEYAAVRETLERLLSVKPGSLSDDGQLLYARSLEEIGEHSRALEQYEHLSRSYPGEEARLRYALLLKRLQRFDEARRVYEEMEKRAKLAPAYYRRKEREHLAAARRELADLARG